MGCCFVAPTLLLGLLLRLLLLVATLLRLHSVTQSLVLRIVLIHRSHGQFARIPKYLEAGGVCMCRAQGHAIDRREGRPEKPQCHEGRGLAVVGLCSETLGSHIDVPLFWYENEGLKGHRRIVWLHIQPVRSENKPWFALLKTKLDEPLRVVTRVWRIGDKDVKMLARMRIEVLFLVDNSRKPERIQVTLYLAVAIIWVVDNKVRW